MLQLVCVKVCLFPPPAVQQMTAYHSSFGSSIHSLVNWGMWRPSSCFFPVAQQVGGRVAVLQIFWWLPFVGFQVPGDKEERLCGHERK